MKKWVAGFLIGILAMGVQAQQTRRGLGACMGSNILVGDSPIRSSQIPPFLGIYGISSLSSKFRLKVQLGYGNFGFSFSRNHFSTPIVPVELVGMYSLGQFSHLRPFLQAGIGVLGFTLNGSGPYFDAMFIGGTALEITLSPIFSILASTDLRYTSGDDFNHTTGGIKDGYFNFHTGIIYYFHHKEYPLKRKESERKRRILAETGSEQREIAFFNRIQNAKVEMAKLSERITELRQEIRRFSKRVAELELEVSRYQKSLRKGKGIFAINDTLQ